MIAAASPAVAAPKGPKAAEKAKQTRKAGRKAAKHIQLGEN